MIVSVLGVPNKVRFQKDSFCILSCHCEPQEPLKYLKGLSVKGHVIGDVNLLIGQEIVFTGELEENQYGFTLSFTNYTINEAVDFFWTSFSGLSEEVQDSIFEKFGRSPDWLKKEDALKQLLTIKGIKEKKAKKIQSKWDEYQNIRLLSEQLSPYDISQKKIAQIYKHFGDNAIKILSKNPYRLVEIRGIGFKKADEIAINFGVDEYSTERLMSAVEFILQEQESNGHSMVDISTIYEIFNELVVYKNGLLFSNSVKEFYFHLVKAINSVNFPKIRKVREKYSWFGLKNTVETDEYILDLFLNFKEEKDAPLSISKAEFTLKLSEIEKGKFKLGDEQKKGLLLASITPYCVAIAGYAGTGKTTVSSILLKILREKFGLKKSDIVCTALSGVAASRIGQQSGYNSYTIHTLLGFDGQKYSFNEDNKLPQKIIVLDESSMVDSKLFKALLLAIDFKKTKLIMLGDPAQVQAIGAGQVFFDLIRLNLVKSIELTEIFRNAGEIPFIAESIRKGIVPLIKDEYFDVKFNEISSGNRKEINNEILSFILKESLDNRWTKTPPSTDEEIWDYITSFQVITPRKTGALSQISLNPMLRQKMLPNINSSVVFKETLTPFTSFEKVIHLTNMDMEVVENNTTNKVKVYNGQLGMVTSVNTDDATVTVRYPLSNYSVVYNEKQIRDGVLGYAWALTIHKTQGAEFKKICIPLTMSHFMMLNNKLFYTAVTRAKERVTLVGESRALSYASTNTQTVFRNTCLGLLVA